MDGNYPAIFENLPASIDSELIRSNRLASRADETKRALLRNWTGFISWCERQGLISLPAHPDAVELYLLYLADKHPVLDRSGKLIRHGQKTSAVCQALWAINTGHRLAGHSPPGETEQIKTAIAGIKRRKGMRKKQQAPMTIDHFREIPFGMDLKGKRNKALLLVGFAGCLRRSELVALNVEDIEEAPYGLRLYLASSKTDQEGAGAWVDVLSATLFPEVCPVQTLKDWMESADIRSGAVFRSLTRGRSPRIRGRLSAVSVDAVVKWAAALIGLNPALYGGHSLRAGKATYLSEHGKSPVTIAKHGRWKSLDMVLTYCRGETARELEGVY